MKKILSVSLGAVLLLTSCGTYTGAGAVTGGSFGSIIGSAIGGIAGGRHGSHVGTLIGMAGGAAVGAAVGAAADNAQQRQYEDYQYTPQRRSSSSASQRRYNYDDNYDSAGSGDDRLYGFDEHFTPSSKTTVQPVAGSGSLEIRNPHLVDASRDGGLRRGEEARMVFEVFNTSSSPIYRVQPTVAEITGNKHVIVSQNVMVECIMPGKGIRYTAAIKADNRLKDGKAIFRIGVSQGDQEISSQTREFSIMTSK